MSSNNFADQWLESVAAMEPEDRIALIQGLLHPKTVKFTLHGDMRPSSGGYDGSCVVLKTSVPSPISGLTLHPEQAKHLFGVYVDVGCDKSVEIISLVGKPLHKLNSSNCAARQILCQFKETE